MATSTRRRPAARGSGRATTSRGRAATPPPREPRLAEFREQASEQLGRHAIDLAAIAFVVVGLLIALGVLTELAGPFGRAIDTALGALFGKGRFLAPLCCFAAGGVLLARGRIADAEDEAEAGGRRGLRVGVGVGVVLAASVGLLHIANGRPDSASLDDLRDAGGVIGALLGQPLASAVGVVGAVIVLVALLLWGLLLVADLRLHQVGAALAVAGRWAGGQVRLLFELPERVADARAGREDVVDLAAAEVDEDEEDEEYEDEEVDGEYEYEDEAYEYEDDDQEDDEEHEDIDDEVVLVRGAHGAGADDYDVYAAGAESSSVAREVALSGEVTGAVAPPPADGAGAPAPAGEGEPGQLQINLGPAHGGTWKLPALSLMKKGNGRKVDARLVEQGGEVLEATLREFGVDARLIGAVVGPTVTRYELELAPGVKVNKVTSLNKEIAYAMAAHDVRILAPIPGRSAIGVEVPNKDRPLITLGDILSSPEAKRATHPCEVAMGRDIAGRAVMANLATFPHVLIAGQTGAGKSSCINSIVTSILMRATPDQVRMILIDPKRVELGQYNNVPHLLTEVVVNPKKAANALDWAVREMEMRYDLLAEVGVRDITGYNQMFDRGELPTEENPDPMGGKSYERLSFIVVVVDELADLMMVAARDVETSICRLAQMARAVGIHLVIATQRPSVDVITGVIKANIPSRLAFSVSTLADSRVILDQPGAEKLIGKGDMLMMAASSSRAERVQGAWVDEDCVRKVVAHWRRQAHQANYVDGIQGDDGAAGRGRGGAEDDSDELFDEAMAIVVREGVGSTSMLQRKLRVGFARAGRLMDLLERRGVVGPSEGSKARVVLMTPEELENLQEQGG